MAEGIWIQRQISRLFLKVLSLVCIKSYTWWKLEGAIEQGWHKLYSKKLARGNLNREDTNEVQRVTDYAGPYLDSSSNEPFELRDPLELDISF